METEKINWTNDFKINESLHAFAQEMSAVYGRMCFNNSEHPDTKEWKEKSLTWADYDRSIKDIVFNTEEKALEEVNRLAKECKELLSLEKSLLHKRE